MATSSLSYHQIISDLKKGKYSPVYFLMGDEPFFIDTISDYIRENALPEEARDFNQLVLYGNDTTMNEVIQRARAYPMGAERQVIIVKEAQHLLKKDSDESGSSNSPGDILAAYVQAPQTSTVLVFCHKNGSLDKRRKVTSVIEKNCIMFDSKKVKDDALPQFITSFLEDNGMRMTPKGISMMAESIGTDLSRLNGELEKLVMAMPEGQTDITPEFIEKHIGISKDFNIFEFKDAIIRRDIYKANQIARYYENNAKTYPIQLITATLFPYFSNLMLAFYSPDKSENGIAQQLDMRSTWGVRDYITGMKNYTASQTMRILNLIRRFDAKSKGLDATANTTDGLLRELLFMILH